MISAQTLGKVAHQFCTGGIHETHLAKVQVDATALTHGENSFKLTDQFRTIRAIEFTFRRDCADAVFFCCLYHKPRVVRKAL